MNKREYKKALKLIKEMMDSDVAYDTIYDTMINDHGYDRVDIEEIEYDINNGIA